MPKTYAPPAISLLASNAPPAMARYQFPIHAMIVMAYVDVLRFEHRAPPWLRVVGTAIILGLSAASLRLQLDLAAMFARSLRVL